MMNVHLHTEVNIPVNDVTLQGELLIPEKCNGLIIFSHGSGSSRFSPRNQQVADYLHTKGFGTLLFDLLSESEDQQYQNRFNIDLLTERLAGATRWLKTLPSARNIPIGYFGASTGAASALQAASRLPEIAAVVCRGGRPDLALSEDLRRVTAPTLLIIGSLDHDVLQLNHLAFLELQCEKKLEIVYGATHLFEEPGKMDIVSALASGWFEKHLQGVTVAG